MESLVLSPMSANWDLILNLILVSAFLRNVAFNQSTWNYLASTRKVIHPTDISHPT